MEGPETTGRRLTRNRTVDGKDSRPGAIRQFLGLDWQNSPLDSYEALPSYTLFLDFDLLLILIYL